MASDLENLQITGSYQAAWIPADNPSDCTLPPFINDVPTIPPLPDFNIVCKQLFAPALPIPAAFVPPCPDGVNVTGGEVAIMTGATPSGSLTSTGSGCTFNITGSLTIPDTGPPGPSGTCPAQCGAYYA